MNTSRFFKCLLFLTVFAGSLQADLIVYDGFDYPVGSLGGNEGGVGWDPGAAWSGGQNVASPGLEYPGLTTAGNSAAAADSASFRTMPAGFDALNNTIWISFLCQNLETPEWCGVSTYNDGDESLFIGKPGGASNRWGVHLYNVLGDTGAKTGSEDSQTSISERVFFVVGIVNGSADARIAAWINPDLDGEPGDGSAFYDSEAAGHKAARVPFNRIRIDGPGEAMFFDELRIGETYADVAGTGNPENASLLQPGDGVQDVSPTPVLAWSPGIYAGEQLQHDWPAAEGPGRGPLLRGAHACAPGGSGLGQHRAGSPGRTELAVRHEMLLGTDPDALGVVATVDIPAYTASLDLDSTVYRRPGNMNDRRQTHGKENQYEQCCRYTRKHDPA